MICASLNSAVFIKNLLRYLAEKIRLLNTTNFRGDYPGAQRAEIKGFAKLVGGSIIIRPLAFDLDIGFIHPLENTCRSLPGLGICGDQR
jgi:hypothetical protein